MSEEKGLGDHISDWFKILIKEGITGLLVGLGFVLVLFGGLMLVVQIIHLQGFGQ